MTTSSLKNLARIFSVVAMSFLFWVKSYAQTTAIQGTTTPGAGCSFTYTYDDNTI
jgi:hypothetical protein